MNIIGHHDRPSTKSLGIVGLFHRVENKVYTSGFETNKVMMLDDFEDYVERGAVSRFEVTYIPKTTDENSVLVWHGNEFMAASIILNFPIDIPGKPVILDKAHCYILGCRDAYLLLKEWTYKAYLKSIKEKNLELARLMRWCMPCEDETRAALWYNLSDKERQAELKWWAQVERMDKSIIEERVRKLAEAVLV
jgi:hypothetical protein